MASHKKAPLPKKSAKELEVEGKMLRCLAEPKKPMSSDYKCTMIICIVQRGQMSF
jgi:hypothetical protein